MIWTWRVRQVAIVATIALVLLVASTLRELSSNAQRALESAGVEGELVAGSILRDLVALSIRDPEASLAVIARTPRIREAMLEAEVSAPSVLHVAIYDARGEIVAHTLDEMVGEIVEPMPTLPQPTGTFEGLRELWAIWRVPTDYSTEWPLVSESGDPIAVIRVVSGSAFLLHDTRETFRRGLTSIIVLVLLSVALGAIAAKSTTRRLRRIESSIAALREGHRVEALPETGWNEFDRVVRELNLLGEHVLQRTRPGGDRAPDPDSLLGDGILVLDSAGSLVLHNASAWTRLGARAQDPTRLEEVLPRGHALLAALRELEDDDDRRSITVELSGSGGDQVALVHRIENENRPVGTLVEIKEHRDHEELQGLVQHSRILNRLGDMAAGVAHELRGPLQGLEFDLDALERVLERPDEAREMLAELQRKIQRLEWVVSGFLKVARVRPQSSEFIDLPEWVGAVCQSVESEALMAGIELEWDVPDAGLRFRGDREILGRALENVISNAIEAQPSRTGKVRVEGRRVGSNLEIEVTDAGPGIEEDRLEGVFDLYFTTKPRGTGVGLALVRQAIELHDGHVRLASRTGEGTTVTLVLPAPSPGRIGKAEN